MRILHTSDWHLGQNFIGKSRLDEHRQFCDWLLQQVQEQSVDAVLIVGDVFDTGAPPSYARELYNHFIVELSRLNCQLVVLAGNHDSVAMLNESKTLLAQLNTQVVAGVGDAPEQQVIVLNQADGQPGAVLCAVPYLRPRDLMVSEAGQSGKQKQQQLGQAISDFYQSRYELAQQLAAAQGNETPLPVIATGHLTAMGVQTSESVRDIYVGSLEAFPASHFPPADYIALGHIHRPQKVAKSDTIRYCGSPIPLSFDELRSQKQVLLVDVAPGERARVTELPVPMFQPMAQLKGDLEDIAEQLSALDTTGELPVWLTIEVSAQAYLNDLQQRIQGLTADYNVEVLQLRRSRVQKSEQADGQQRETLAELNPQDVFEQRLAREDFSSDAEQQRLQRLRTSFAQVLGEVRDNLDEDDQALAAELTRAATAVTQTPVTESAAAEQMDEETEEQAADAVEADAVSEPDVSDSDASEVTALEPEDMAPEDVAPEDVEPEDVAPEIAEISPEPAPVGDLFGSSLPESGPAPVAEKKPVAKTSSVKNSETAEPEGMQQQSLIDGF